MRWKSMPTFAVVGAVLVLASCDNTAGGEDARPSVSYTPVAHHAEEVRKQYACLAGTEYNPHTPGHWTVISPTRVQTGPDEAPLTLTRTGGSPSWEPADARSRQILAEQGCK